MYNIYFLGSGVKVVFVFTSSMVEAVGNRFPFILLPPMQE
jgi:hypothetical protein